LSKGILQSKESGLGVPCIVYQILIAVMTRMQDFPQRPAKERVYNGCATFKGVAKNWTRFVQLLASRSILRPLPGKEENDTGRVRFGQFPDDQRRRVGALRKHFQATMDLLLPMCNHGGAM
jgi:hypothetical protein